MRKELNKKIAHQWDDTIPEGLQERIKQRQGRRQFLKAAGVVPAAMLIAACENDKVTSVTPMNAVSAFAMPPWNTFFAVQNHLFPKDDDSPGAEDINATGYLKSVLALPDMDSADKKFILDGVNWTNDLSRQMFDHDFYQLTKNKKEQVLQRISLSSAGENWLSLLLLYIFEALIADPVYGGNTDKIGWQWLNHIPGFPQPPENKKYYLLK